MNHAPQFWLIIILTLILPFSFSGCATTDDSDLPWNSQEPWEAAPTIPGLPNY